ncbi:MAG: hypothetical protein ABWZ02_01075, partial [Nakamurella sp.]
NTSQPVDSPRERADGRRQLLHRLACLDRAVTAALLLLTSPAEWIVIGWECSQYSDRRPPHRQILRSD